MSIHDEQDLRARLGFALDDFAPSPMSFDAVVKQGRAIKIRRRVTAAAAALAVLAAASLVPTLVHALFRPPPPVTHHYHVTVHPGGPGSPQGLVASGLVNRVRWRLTVRYDPRSGNTCIASIPDAGTCGAGLPPARAVHGAPASLDGDTNEWGRLPGGRGVHLQMVDGYVRADVDHVRVDLTNGQVLLLQPVPVHGSRYARWVAFAVPFATAVKEISVFSATGALEHTFPFTGAGSIDIVRWLPPSHPALPKPAFGHVGSGTTNGQHWTVRGYLGPWGSCFRNGTVDMNICSSQAGPLRPGVVVKLLAASHSGHISLSVAQVESQVSYLIVTTVRGGALHLRPKILGGQKYVVLPNDDNNHDVTWTAYDAVGHLLGNGSVAKLVSGLSLAGPPAAG